MAVKQEISGHVAAFERAVRRVRALEYGGQCKPEDVVYVECLIASIGDALAEGTRGLDRLAAEIREGGSRENSEIFVDNRIS